jgi:hypothetical protein
MLRVSKRFGHPPWPAAYVLTTAWMRFADIDRPLPRSPSSLRSWLSWIGSIGLRPAKYVRSC